MNALVGPVAAALVAVACHSAAAEGIVRIDYALIKVPPGDLVTFNGIRDGSGPYTNIPGLLDIGPAVVGERFHGQTTGIQTNTDGFDFDVVRDDPRSPLTVRAGGTKRNLSVEVKTEFNSDVLYGVGSVGVDDGAGAGEGTIAMLFDEDVCHVGFKTLLEEPNIPMAALESFGKLNVTFYDRQGAVIGREVLSEEIGVLKLGFSQIAGEEPRIAGILIQNFDRGGVPIDDLRSSSHCDLQIS